MTHSEDLDAEGMPDLDDSLPQKELSGDAQEGMVPPRDYNQAPTDYWAHDTLEQRLREEVPDRLTPSDENPPLMDPTEDELHDGPAEVVQTGDEGGALSAEEAAIHVTDKPPGAVDRDRDSYTGDPIP